MQFLLHLLLEIYSRSFKKRSLAAASEPVGSQISAADVGLAAASEHVAALQHALAAVASEHAFPQLQNLDGDVWQKWQVLPPSCLLSLLHASPMHSVSLPN